MINGFYDDYDDDDDDDGYGVLYCYNIIIMIIVFDVLGRFFFFLLKKFLVRHSNDTYWAECGESLFFSSSATKLPPPAIIHQ